MVSFEHPLILYFKILFFHCGRMEEPDQLVMSEVKIEIDVAEELPWTDLEDSQGGYR